MWTSQQASPSMKPTCTVWMQSPERRKLDLDNGRCYIAPCAHLLACVLLFWGDLPFAFLVSFWRRGAVRLGLRPSHGLNRPHGEVLLSPRADYSWAWRNVCIHFLTWMNLHWGSISFLYLHAVSVNTSRLVLLWRISYFLFAYFLMRQIHSWKID